MASTGIDRNRIPSNPVGNRKRKTIMQKYVCNVCGYVYDPETGDPANGIAAGTPFEALPEDWTCPECGVGKDQFAPV
jgi:rubredoxin